MQNLENTIISQFANSPRINALLNNLNEAIDPTYNFNQFYYNIWNILSANGIGLDIWGRIVGVSRTLEVGTSAYLGFEQQSEAEPFDQAPFFNAVVSGSLTENVNLTDDAYRTLILAKSLLNLTNCSIPAINQILMFLFVTNVYGRTGQAYCTDEGNMEMTYTFNNLNPALTPVELAIIGQSNVLPRPCGVAVTLVQIP